MKRTVLFSFAMCMFAATALAASGNAGLFPAIPPRSTAGPQERGSGIGRNSALSGSEKVKIAKFVNANRPHDLMTVLPVDVVDSGWARVGEGKSDFLVLFDFSERSYANRLWLYSRRKGGALSIQEIEGWEMGPLENMVRDLNGDGRDELIIPEALGPSGVWFPLMAMPTWSAVYRLQHGKYVEASRDFSKYYDNDVLPRLDQRIRRAQALLPQEPFQEETVAVAEMTRDKILRVLGRNPAAGLNQAYRWMNSRDPQVMQCAIVTFADIVGHENEVRTLQKELPAAITRVNKARKGK